MKPIEIKKMKNELLGVSHARGNLEIRIEEMKEEIERLVAHIDIQLAKEKEIKDKLTSLGEK